MSNIIIPPSSSIPGPVKERWTTDVDSYSPNRLQTYPANVDGRVIMFDAILHTWSVRSRMDVELSQASEGQQFYMQAWVHRNRDSYQESLKRARQTLENIFGFDIVGDRDLWNDNWGLVDR